MFPSLSLQVSRAATLRWLVLGAALVGLLALPVAAHAAGSVYVANFHSDTVSQYTIDPVTGALSPKSPATVPTDPTPTHIAVSPDGNSAYVASFNGAVSQYDIDSATGALSPKSPPTVVAGRSPWDVAVSPDGKSAYVTDYGDNTVSQYDVDPITGALSPKTPATVSADSLPTTVAVSPDGESAYVVNSVPGSVSQYDVDPTTGALSPKTPATIGAGFNANNLAVSPDGRSLYVSVDGSPVGIWQYDIDPVTGTLSYKVPTIVAASGPLGMALSPDGSSAYVANQLANTVLLYDVDSGSGALSPKTPATAFSSNPVFIALSADAKSAYVTNYSDNTLSQYDIDPTAGALSPKTPATVAAGPAPYGVTSGRLPIQPTRHATATSIDCSPATVGVGQSTTCTAMVTDVASSDKTTPTGTVGFASNGLGAFSGSPCTLSGSGGSASCSVKYTPSGAGAGRHTIQASYGGDATHKPSGGTSDVTVAPTSKTQCKKGGWRDYPKFRNQGLCVAFVQHLKLRARGG